MSAGEERHYDLAVVGGGTAGLVAAVGAAGQGARVVLVERDRTGGDCLWTGCVPSKALIAAASRAHAVRTAARFGVTTGPVTVDLRAVMAHVHAAREAIAPHDSPERLEREGVEVVAGHARFVSPRSLAVAGRTLRFRHAVIATGAAPTIPAVRGLAEAAPLTSETLWDLETLPERLLVVGGGAIGCELGQAFARLGARVTIVEVADRLLPSEEPEASAIVEAALIADGVEVLTATRLTHVGDDASGRVVGLAGPEGRRREVTTDRILVAAGRTPRTADLGCDVAGVALDGRGAVVVDARQRTTNPRIHAGGDVTGRLPFTHVAAAHGTAIVQNALFGLRARVDHERIPWVTFTDPEVARVGPTAAEARARDGERARAITSSHARLDRAIAVGDTEGFAQLVSDAKGRLIGATVVGPRAGETIAEVVAWMASGARLATIVRSSTHAYPTWNEDLANASLTALRADLARYATVTRGLLRARRLLGR